MSKPTMSSIPGAIVRKVEKDKKGGVHIKLIMQPSFKGRDGDYVNAGQSIFFDLMVPDGHEALRLVKDLHDSGTLVGGKPKDGDYVRLFVRGPLDFHLNSWEWNGKTYFELQSRLHDGVMVSDRWIDRPKSQASGLAQESDCPF